MRQSQITQWCQAIIESQAVKEGLYIDATMGNGNDTALLSQLAGKTAFLCRLAGENGHVLAFDVQEKALHLTKERLTKEELADRAELYLCGHEHMAEYAGEETVDVICFNFGYLPGGDHKAETSMQAILQGLKLLKRGGMMSLCIYSGGDTGFEEKDAILNLLRTLPSREYTVIANEYYNRKNNPPMPVFIFKS